MTVPATSQVAGPYVGNGVTTSFPFNFKTLDRTHLRVLFVDDGVTYPLALDSQYSVTLNVNQDAAPGGTVTYPLSGSPLAADQTLTIVGAVPMGQATDLPDGGSFSAAVVENALDVLALQNLQQQQQLNLAIKLPDNTPPGVVGTLPVPLADRLIGWNSSGTGLRNVDPTTLATIVSTASWTADVFNGDGSRVNFTLSFDPGNVNAIDVSVGGVTQIPVDDFSVVGNILVFASPPPIGTRNILVRYGQSLPQGVSTAAAVTYLPGRSGAVPTNVQAKLRETVSVTDFGADPTGTVGSAAAIQLALNSGARVVQARGRFLIDADLILPDEVIFDCTDAVMLASANGRTLIKSNVSSYLSQIWGGIWDGNGRSNVTAMDLSNFRLRSYVLGPFIRDCTNGIIARTGCFGARLADVATARVTNAIQVLENGSVLVIDNPAIDNGGSVGGPNTGIGIDIRFGLGDNIGVQVRGGFVQGHTVGIRDAGIKTVVSDVYIELCTTADIEGLGARASNYRCQQHYGPTGPAAYRLRNCDAVTIFDPSVASGARTVVYDIDGTNTNCVEYRADSNAFLNNPLGSLANLQQIPRQITGTFTPVVSGSGTPGTGTYTTQSGTFVRTGNILTVNLTVTWSAHSGSGNITITGIPASVGTPGTFTPLRMFQAAVIGAPVTGPVLYAYFTGSGTALAIGQHTAAGSASLVPLATAGTVHITGTITL